ncbi:MAG: hypothetical protein PHF37_10320 [Phycisphaerae bacterium]|nr:hypothetical protein [Phycisphaerae bacterium]
MEIKQNNTMVEIRKNYLQPAFLICAVVLGLAAAGMSYAIKEFDVHLTKIPIALMKSLDLIDETRLFPYTVASKQKIENHEIVEALGTEDYIQWVLEDTQVESDSPIRYCFLFITYYSKSDRVPHVPEECYTGSGHQKLASDAFSVNVNMNGEAETIPVKYLVFGSATANSWYRSNKFGVMYMFNVNNKYANSREEARLLLNKNIFGKSSYFSKVEWKFYNVSAGMHVYPDKEQAIAASEKLLGSVLPILENDHWPKNQ